MRTFDDYLEAALIVRIAQGPSEITQRFSPEETVLTALDAYISVEVDHLTLKRLLTKFIDQNVFIIVKDEVAGDFYKLDHAKIVQLFQADVALQETLVGKYHLLGNQLLELAYQKLFLKSDTNIERPILDQPGLTVPASDRVVTLQHNQQGEIESSFGEVIEAIQEINGIEGDGHLREIVLGELKAGRELVRAQTFRALLLYNTVISSLGKLIEKYKDHAIGAAATRLIELLIEHIFGVQ